MAFSSTSQIFVVAAGLLASCSAQHQDALLVSSAGNVDLMRKEVSKHNHAQKDHVISGSDVKGEVVPVSKAVPGASSSPLKEMNEIEDDKLMGTDHICGGAGAHEIERYPGPTGRLLMECRQSCMDDKSCFFYAYWPENSEGKNKAGECKNNCRLYDKCSAHSGEHEKVDTKTCRAYLFSLGRKTNKDRPEYAKTKKSEAIEGGARPMQSLNAIALVALLAAYINA